MSPNTSLSSTSSAVEKQHAASRPTPSSLPSLGNVFGDRKIPGPANRQYGRRKRRKKRLPHLKSWTATTLTLCIHNQPYYYFHHCRIFVCITVMPHLPAALLRHPFLSVLTTSSWNTTVTLPRLSHPHDQNLLPTADVNNVCGALITTKMSVFVTCCR